jgi:hypothetical protein
MSLFLILSIPIMQMFQTPALVVMTIGATRMHRSLVDFANSEYYASYFLFFSFILTAADITVARVSTSTQPGSGAR